MIDYIITRRRDRDECMDSRSLVSADCDSDHQLVWAKMEGRRWNKKPKMKQKKKRDYGVLKDEVTRKGFEQQLSRNLENLTSWSSFQSAMNDAVEKICPKKEGKTHG